MTKNERRLYNACQALLAAIGDAPLGGALSQAVAAAQEAIAYADSHQCEASIDWCEQCGRWGLHVDGHCVVCRKR